MRTLGRTTIAVALCYGTWRVLQGASRVLTENEQREYDDLVNQAA